MKVELGKKYRDKITGIEGTAVGRTEWLYGCVRITIQPHEHKDGKIADHVWIDEPQLELIKEVPAIKAAKKMGIHGPRPEDPGRPVDKR